MMTLFSCATCIGQEGQTSTLAANGAVFVMLGALGFVFLFLLSVCIAFVRRARRLERASSSASL